MTIPHLPVGTHTVLLAEAWQHSARWVAEGPSVSIISRSFVDGAVDLQSMPLRHEWSLDRPGYSGEMQRSRCKQFFVALFTGVVGRAPQTHDHDDLGSSELVDFCKACMQHPFPWRGARARVVVTEKQSPKRPEVSIPFEEWLPVAQDAIDIARGRVHLAPLTREAEACAAELKALDPSLRPEEQDRWMALFGELMYNRDPYRGVCA